jgi:peptidoglycan/LPS O-acetylase OafA/YrhL
VIAPLPTIDADAARRSPGNRRDDIQGIRALAMLMILAYHMGLPGPGNFTGPEVFFVVSGFVVTGMLLRERRSTGRIAIVQFYLRRARRLAPALAVTSIATLALAACVFSPIGTDQQATGAAIVAANTLRANLYFLRETGGYFQPLAQANPFLHSWTLSVEEQFYLAFPITLVGLWAIGRRLRDDRWVHALLSLGCLASLGACIALSYGHTPPDWTFIGRVVGAYDSVRVAFFYPLTRAWEFIAGVILAMAAVRWKPGALVRHGASIAGAVLVVVTIVAIQSTDHFPGALALLPVLAASGLIVGGLGPSLPIVNRLLAIRPLVWMGDRSYSWYLWHWPLIVFARAYFAGVPSAPMIAGILSVVPATLSFRFVEEPIHRRRVWPSRTATVAIAAVSILAPVVCALAFTSAVEHAWGNAEIAHIRSSAVPNHIDITASCASFTPLGDPTRPPCVWATPASRGTFLLVGDSHAGHFSEPFIAAANALHYDAQVATAGGCPFLHRPAYPTDACRQFVEGTLAAVVGRAPAFAGIVISNATTGYLDGSLAAGFAPDGAPGAPLTRTAEIAGWVASLTRTIEAVGHRSAVIVVGAVPQFYQVPQCLHPTLFEGPAPGCGVWTPLWAATERSDFVAAERAAVLALGATYFDAGAKLCPAGKGCSAFIDGQLAYRDGGHLNVESALKFEPDFQAALAAAATVEHASGHAQ